MNCDEFYIPLCAAIANDDLASASQYMCSWTKKKNSTSILLNRDYVRNFVPAKKHKHKPQSKSLNLLLFDIICTRNDFSQSWARHEYDIFCVCELWTMLISLVLRSYFVGVVHI